MSRYIIEGIWTGYASGQTSEICHRTVHKASEKKLREWAEKACGIGYANDDNPRLILTVRDCLPGERVKEIYGYTELIDHYSRSNVHSVDEMREYEKRQRI